MRRIVFELLMMLVLLLTSVGCSHEGRDGKESQVNRKENCLSVLGVSMQGTSEEEIIKNLIKKTPEFDYYYGGHTSKYLVRFCRVPCGLNIISKQIEGTTVVTSLVVFTSFQDKATFDTFKRALSKRYGNPDIEEHEGDDEEIEGMYYGTCRWNKRGIALRHINSEEGGLVIIFI